MSSRCTVVIGEYTYPADPISRKTILASGGLSKMTEHERSQLKFKTVTVGGECGDMPEPALSIYIRRGWVQKEPSTRTKPIHEEVWKDLGRPADSEDKPTLVDNNTVADASGVDEPGEGV